PRPRYAHDQRPHRLPVGTYRLNPPAVRAASASSKDIPAMRGIATKSPSWTLLFGGGEVEERHTGCGAVHDLLPDRGRDGSPEDLTGIEGVADREVLHPGGFARVILCAAPDRGGQLRGVAGDPGLVGAAA